MGQLQVQLDRIRRRWVLIVVIALAAGAAAAGAVVLQGTTYTGKAALTIGSSDRSPEQDAVLAQGYADYFNQPSTQQVLRQKAGVDETVSFDARTAAASPIVYVEATAKDSTLAADSATKMATTFRDDVRNNLGTGAADTLRQQLASEQARLAGLPAASPDRSGINSSINDIQGKLADIQSRSAANQLQDLQLSAGVVKNANNLGRNVAAAVLGGLVVGIVLAVALGRFENRITTSAEVEDRLGQNTLARVGERTGRGADREQARGQRFQALTGLVGSTDLPMPGTLAITSSGPGQARSQVALSLAALRALQGQTTVLLQADMTSTTERTPLSNRPGVADFLAATESATLEGKVFSNGRGLIVSPPGQSRADVFTLFSRAHLADLVRQARSLADLVIIDAPSPNSTTEGQLVCSAADATILVIEEGDTRVAEATKAVEAIEHTRSRLLGVVSVENGRGLADLGLLAGDWSPVDVPAMPPMGSVAAQRPMPPRPPQGGPMPPQRPTPPAAAPQAENRTTPISRAQLDEEIAKNNISRASVSGKGVGTPGAGSSAAAAKPAPEPSAPKAAKPAPAVAPAPQPAAKPGPAPTNGATNGAANGAAKGPTNGTTGANGSAGTNGAPGGKDVTVSLRPNSGAPSPSPAAKPSPMASPAGRSGPAPAPGHAPGKPATGTGTPPKPSDGGPAAKGPEPAAPHGKPIGRVSLPGAGPAKGEPGEPKAKPTPSPKPAGPAGASGTAPKKPTPSPRPRPGDQAGQDGSDKGGNGSSGVGGPTVSLPNKR